MNSTPFLCGDVLSKQGNTLSSAPGEPWKPRKNHIISWRKIREFLETHPDHRDAEGVFDRWYRLMVGARLNNFGDVRRRFPSASQVGPLIVFHVGSTKYRVVVRVFHKDFVILIRHVLTHPEYDEGKWKQ